MRFLGVLGLFLALAGVGCSTSDDPAPATPATDPEAARLLPRAVSLGGAVVKAPKLVTVVFPGDPLAATVLDFGAKLAASAHWKNLTDEYGIGPLATAAVTAEGAAPAKLTEDDVERWLRAQLTGDHPLLGAPDPQSLYAIYYPAGTVITGEGETSCEDYGAYHLEMDIGATHIGYAVIPRCAAEPPSTDLAEVTVSASHEIVEWASDPFPNETPAYDALSDGDFAWAVYGAELADLCSGQPSLSPPDVGYELARIWSNRLAGEGRLPCMPVDDAPYFMAYPEQPDTFDVPWSEQGDPPTRAKGIRVPGGGSRTVAVHMRFGIPAGAAGDAWALSVSDQDETLGYFSHEGDAKFRFALDAPTGVAGGTRTLTITAPAMSTTEHAAIVVERGGARYAWPFFVATE